METPTDKNADTQINELKKRLKPTIERLWAASGKEPKFLKIMQTYFWDMDKLHLTGPIGISELEKAFPSFSLFSLGHTAQTAIQDFTNLKKGINDIIVADRAQVRNELNSLSEGNTPDSWKAYQNASVKIKINKYASGWINTPTLPGQMFKSKEELVKAVNDIEDRNPKNPFHETPTSIYYNAVRFIWQNKKKTPTRETPTSF